MDGDGLMGNEISIHSLSCCGVHARPYVFTAPSTWLQYGQSSHTPPPLSTTASSSLREELFPRRHHCRLLCCSVEQTQFELIWTHRAGWRWDIHWYPSSLLSHRVDEPRWLNLWLSFEKKFARNRQAWIETTRKLAWIWLKCWRDNIHLIRRISCFNRSMSWALKP